MNKDIFEYIADLHNKQIDTITKSLDEIKTSIITSSYRLYNIENKLNDVVMQLSGMDKRLANIESKYNMVVTATSLIFKLLSKWQTWVVIVGTYMAIDFHNLHSYLKVILPAE